MAKITVTIDGKLAMESDAHTLARIAVAEVMTTQNIGSKTVAAGLKTLDSLGGAKLFAESLRKGFAKNPAAMVEIREDDKLTARGTVANVANRILIALDVKNWSVEIFTEKKESKSVDSVPQTLPVW